MGDSIDPATAAAEVCRRVTIESQSIAVYWTDAVQSSLKQYFDNPNGKNVIRDACGAFKRGPADVISKAFVAGLPPPEFELRVGNKLDMKGPWKDKPDEFFDLVRKVAIEWRTVELANKQRHQTRAGWTTPRGKSSAKQLAGKSAGRAADKASIEVVTCLECQKLGHFDPNCPLTKFPVKVSSQPAVGRGNGGQFGGSFTGRGQPLQQRQQRPQ